MKAFQKGIAKMNRCPISGSSRGHVLGEFILKNKWHQTSPFGVAVGDLSAL